MANKPKRITALDRLRANSVKQKAFANYSGRRGPGRGKKPPKRAIPIQVEAMEASASLEIENLKACTTTKDVGKLFRKWQRSFRRKAIKALAKRTLPEDRKEMVQNLLMRAGATGNLVLINEAVGNAAFKELHRRLAALLDMHPDTEVVFVTAISGDGATSHTKTEIELFNSQRRITSTLRAISPHFFGITELAVFNSQGHPDGGQMLQRHEHALVWGPGVRAKAALVAAKHADRYPPNFTGARVLDVRSVDLDPVNLCRMAAYLFKAPSKMMNWNPGKDGKPGHMNQSTKGDRFTRYLRLAYIRSLLTFEDVTFGGGEGNRIRGDMVRYLRSVTENAAAGGNRILHPDAVPSLWVELAKELKLPSWTLPIIKTSK